MQAGGELYEVSLVEEVSSTIADQDVIFPEMAPVECSKANSC